MDEFESNIYPKESATFSIPPARDGSQINESLLPLTGGDEEALESFLFPGDGAKIVTFIDNVRDDNFYDTNNAQRSDLHRRLLLVVLQRARRPEHDDPRRVRLDPPDAREPA